VSRRNELRVIFVERQHRDPLGVLREQCADVAQAQLGNVDRVEALGRGLQCAGQTLDGRRPRRHCEQHAGLSATRGLGNLEDVYRRVVDFDADGIAQAPANSGAHFRRQYFWRFDLHDLVVVCIDDATGCRAARPQLVENCTQPRP
jgi:hypothetical protein